MVQKVFLFLAVTSTLITIYFGFGTEPDVVLWNWFGYEYGFNLSGNPYWKLMSIATWGLYILSREVKDEGDNNNGINGNTNNAL